ncbi:cysteine-rich repeat secretory protein 38-like [Cryptomeria japonica]|uniref:cysteine-rich repeat secretory protein 38-like n=1 Tax=Cryptomeria japonica TaxID=3369 RepID=UPI0027D9EEA9|nr:cysteine-rich repeat secretory protein 38-like [Cryptomeria japonica]
MNFPSAISAYVRHTCNDSSKITDGSTYSTNLNLVINDLFLNAPQSSGFNTSSRGQSPNKVYSLLQCTENISAERCSKCVLEANKTIQNVCHNDMSGLIWFDDCFLHYDNSNFISILDASGESYSNQNDISSDMDSFQTTTTDLLSNLSNKAYIPANKGFSTGSANYSASGKLYGLVQCWKDISIQDCKTCLVKARNQMGSCCSTKEGAQVLYGSCKIRYELYPFYDSAQEPSSSPVGSPSTTSAPFLPPTAAPFSPKKINETSLTTTKLKIIETKSYLIVFCRKVFQNTIYGIGTHGRHHSGVTYFSKCIEKNS